jgi:hypothetical protein
LRRRLRRRRRRRRFRRSCAGWACAVCSRVRGEYVEEWLPCAVYLILLPVWSIRHGRLGGAFHVSPTHASYHTPEDDIHSTIRLFPTRCTILMECWDSSLPMKTSPIAQRFIKECSLSMFLLFLFGFSYWFLYFGFIYIYCLIMCKILYSHVWFSLFNTFLILFSFLE